MSECQGCEAIRREIAAVKDLLTARIDGAEKVADLRASATERALELQTADLTRQLSAHGAAIADLRGSRDTGVGRQSVLTVVVSLAISGVFFLLSYFRPGGGR